MQNYSSGKNKTGGVEESPQPAPGAKTMPFLIFGIYIIL
jgi:hypothetical protein